MHVHQPPPGSRWWEQGEAVGGGVVEPVADGKHQIGRRNTRHQRGIGAKAQ